MTARPPPRARSSSRSTSWRSWSSHAPAMVATTSNDLVYRTERAKFEAVADEVEELHELGRPALVGTVSIEKSEELAELLTRRASRTRCSMPSSTSVRPASWRRRGASAASPSPRTWPAAAPTSSSAASPRAAIPATGSRSTRRSWRPAASPSSAPSATSRAASTTSSAAAPAAGRPRHSRFFVSFEDDIMRRFAPDWLPA